MLEVQPEPSLLSEELVRLEEEVADVDARDEIAAATLDRRSDLREATALSSLSSAIIASYGRTRRAGVDLTRFA